MFRDLKEYQEIAKIYAEKVSKPEDLDENRNTRGQALRMQREKNKPAPSASNKPFEKPAPSASNKRAEMSINKRTPAPSNTDASGKVIPTTAEIRAKAAAKRGQPVTGGGNAGASTDSGGTSQIPTRTTFTRQGKERTRAQQMAADRIAAKKASPMDRQLSGREKAQAMAKARIAAKKKAEMSEGMAGALVKGGSKLVPTLMTGIGAVGTMMQSKKKQDTKSGQGFGGEKPANAEVKGKKKEKKPRLNIGKKASGRDRNFIQGGGFGNMESVEYDAYDIVLEYLLSTEQAATIEEANYVMTEMDAKTIQDIVAINGEN